MIRYSPSAIWASGLTFEELQLGLRGLDIGSDPAVAHGALCGCLCVAPVTVEEWLELLGESSRGREHGSALETLAEVYTETKGRLEGGSLEFSPLLPGDDEPLERRAEALALWCEGFLYGFGVGGAIDLARTSPELQEVLSDLAEFTRAAVYESDATEEAETAYSELFEYVRVGVQLIYDELNEGGGGSDANGLGP